MLISNRCAGRRAGRGHTGTNVNGAKNITIPSKWNFTRISMGKNNINNNNNNYYYNYNELRGMN
jgi:hypothetical protein